MTPRMRPQDETAEMSHTSSTTNRGSRSRRLRSCSASMRAVLATSCSGVTYSSFRDGRSLCSSCRALRLYPYMLARKALSSLLADESTSCCAAFETLGIMKLPHGPRARTLPEGKLNQLNSRGWSLSPHLLCNFHANALYQGRAHDECGDS